MDGGARYEIEPNISPIDPYIVAHYGVGMLYGVARTPWWLALVLATGFEWVERFLKRANPAAFPAATQDSWQNSAFDVLAVMAGWATARTGIVVYRRRRAPALNSMSQMLQ